MNDSIPPAQDAPLNLQQHSDFSFQFGNFIAEQSGVNLQDPAIRTIIGLINQHQSGNACLDLEMWANQPLPLSNHTSAQYFAAPDLTAWKKILLSNPCIGQPGDSQPLILDNDLLYLHRYFSYETSIAKFLVQKITVKPEIDEARLENSLSRLFSGADADIGQKNAAIKATEHSFCVISGGPGTGKTTTIVKILALLLDQNPSMKIGLAAPTGKAAARMSESIVRRINDYELDDSVKSLMPTTASTIHRLLGYHRNGFRYNNENPLYLDCLVIDEASMLDLALMNHLLTALPAQCRLILLGDRDQLSSVAAGNVLADITGQNHNSLAANPEIPDIANNIALLKKSHRFAEGRGIAELSKLINNGDSDAVIDLLQHDSDELQWIQTESNSNDTPGFSQQALEFAIQNYKALFTADSPDKALQIYDSMRILTSQHEGPLGVETLNRKISEHFLRQGLIDRTDNFQGQPILIDENYYDLGLFNGDTGLLWPDTGGQLKAWFRNFDGGMHSIRLSLIPKLHTAWAMTVHKAQGSEFNSVLLIVGEPENNLVLTRSWLYTAVTRARHICYLQSAESTIRKVSQQVESRQSGLANRLGW